MEWAEFIKVQLGSIGIGNLVSQLLCLLLVLINIWYIPKVKPFTSRNKRLSRRFRFVELAAWNFLKAPIVSRLRSICSSGIQFN